MNLKTLWICFAVLFTAVMPARANTAMYAGGWYAYACPNGERAVLIKDRHIDTHVGGVPLPLGQNTLYLTLPCDGSGRIAAVGGRDDRAWEWVGGQWHDRGSAFGVNAVIYDAKKQLRVVWEAGTPTGSQGWRYVDDAGDLVTGDASYADVERHLWERTCRGNICCGQGGDEEGLQCLVSGRRVLVRAGVVRFVRFERAGAAIALAWIQQDEASAGIATFTEASLNALPTYTLPTAPPAEVCGNLIDDDGDGRIDEGCPIVVEPGQPDRVECGPIPSTGQEVLQKLWARADVNALVRGDDEQRRAAARMFAEQLAFTVDPRWGTKRADKGRPPSKDGVARFVDTPKGPALCGWDIVNGSTRELSFPREGEALIGPDGKIGTDDDQVFITVDPVDHLGDGKPKPPDPPEDTELKRLRARIAELETDLEVMSALHDKAVVTALELAAQVSAQKTEIETLRADVDAKQRLIADPCKLVVVSVHPSWLSSFAGTRCKAKP